MKNIQQEVISGNINPYELLDLWKEPELSREDIESLGIKYIKTYGVLNEDYFEFNDDARHYMDYDYDTQYCRIAFNEDGDITRFSGTIKNKSELKRILKQIEIK